MEQDTSLDPRRFRSILGAFPTGVALLTTDVQGEYFAMTINSFTSVSLQPPVVSVCLMPDARTTQAILERGQFAVSFLGRRHEELSLRFAKPGEKSFDGVSLLMTSGGLPVVAEAEAFLACRLHDRHQVGDHVVVFGEVVECSAIEERDPLVFHSGRFRELARLSPVDGAI